MKFQHSILLILMSLLTFSCVDDLADYGSGVLPSTDAIAVGADTFHLATGYNITDSIISYPDSFLLGKFHSAKYGATKADILTQFAYTPNYKFPAQAVMDSAFLVLNFKKWQGDEQAPIRIVVHDMNLNGLQNNVPYYSSINPYLYSTVSDEDTLGTKTFKMKDYLSMGSDTTHISIPLSKQFVVKMGRESVYLNDSAFHSVLKGAYITSDFGSAVMMYVERLYIRYHYHYTYVNPLNNVVETVNKTMYLSSNNEVRQVNRFEHPKQNEFVKHRDSVEYISSPANMYATINLPAKRIYDRIAENPALTGSRKEFLSQAQIRVDVTEMMDSTTEFQMPLPSNLLLIRADYEKKFFSSNSVPTTYDTKALLGSLSYSYNDTTDTYKYYYTFDAAAMLANEFVTAKKNNPTAPVVPEQIPLKLIPVSVGYSSSGTVSVVKPQSTISGVTIRSGNVKENGTTISTEPMYMKLVYSIF